MKKMMKTSTAIFASTAPDKPSRNLLTIPSPSCGVDRAGELAHAAKHDDHEGVDDVALPEVGPDVAELRQRATGEAGDARSQSERERIDAARRHADAARHGAVLRDRAHEQAEPRSGEQEPHREQPIARSR